MKWNGITAAIYAACAGVLAAVVTVAVWVARIDPASGMGM